MSVQFGRWNFEGQQPPPDYIEKVSAFLAPYGPDSNESYSKGGVKILYDAFHTTKESRRETQPHISASGAVITWDGRLDNRAELVIELRDSLTIASTDVAIVAAAYEKWGANCFAKLIGDWALSIWNPNNRLLVLAKDPIGTRHLYYSIDKDQVTWCTILDPLVLFAGKTFAICEEYIAGWFSSRPAAHLTPYVGIHAVPPSSSVLLRLGKHIVSKYWNFDPAKKIRYRTDAEYEEHFRVVFAEAVQRRLRSDSPVLAELSGGMDSSSIVCMADNIIARGAVETPWINTLSWYNDADPTLDERPYFTKVEEKRGRTGCHIDLGARSQKEESEADSEHSFMSEFESDRLAATPVSNRRPSSELFKQSLAYMRSQGHRVVLSGIGGEEATGGGVPTPMPALQNLLARGRFVTLVRQLNAWAAKMQKPRLPLLREAIRGFLFPTTVDILRDTSSLPWFDSGFALRHRVALCGYPSKIKVFGPLPSFQYNIEALNAVQRFLGSCQPYSELLREVRYPYLDRDLLEFAYAIPREQLVGVGRRRHLMKRALVGIVPDELLNRRQEAFVPQEQKEELSAEWPSMLEIGGDMVSSSVGFINAERFLEMLQKAGRNEEVPVGSLKSTLFLESWLRHLTIQGVLTNSVPTKRQNCSHHSERLPRASEGSEESLLAPLEAKELPAAAHSPKFS